jgi:hypothetical protein
MNIILSEKPATHRGEQKLVVHKQAEVLPHHVVVVRQKTQGGYWDGSRIYIGSYQEQEVFIVSVPDSGEGTSRFQDWLIEQGVSVQRYVAPH